MAGGHRLSRGRRIGHRALGRGHRTCTPQAVTGCGVEAVAAGSPAPSVHSQTWQCVGTVGGSSGERG